jgi:hypothetical protein
MIATQPLMGEGKGRGGGEGGSLLQAFYGGMMGGQWIFLSDEERRTHCPGE